MVKYIILPTLIVILAILVFMAIDERGAGENKANTPRVLKCDINSKEEEFDIAWVNDTSYYAIFSRDSTMLIQSFEIANNMMIYEEVLPRTVFVKDGFLVACNSLSGEITKMDMRVSANPIVKRWSTGKTIVDMSMVVQVSFPFCNESWVHFDTAEDLLFVNLGENETTIVDRASLSKGTEYHCYNKYIVRYERNAVSLAKIENGCLNWTDPVSIVFNNMIPPFFGIQFTPRYVADNFIVFREGDNPGRIYEYMPDTNTIVMCEQYENPLRDIIATWVDDDKLYGYFVNYETSKIELEIRSISQRESKIVDSERPKRVNSPILLNHYMYLRTGSQLGMSSKYYAIVTRDSVPSYEIRNWSTGKDLYRHNASDVVDYWLLGSRMLLLCRRGDGSRYLEIVETDSEFKIGVKLLRNPEYDNIYVQLLVEEK